MKWDIGDIGGEKGDSLGGEKGGEGKREEER